MNDDPRIDDLLDVWEEARVEGKLISVEELCQDCPELADEIGRQICKLERVDRIFVIDEQPYRTDLAKLPKTLGRYRLDEQIGEGGFGQVWKGFDPKLERNVAIKVLKPERSCSVLQVDRFLSEARKVARLRHKNIVTVHETDHDGKWYFMVTEWINGRDLAHRLSVSRLPLEESVRLIAKIADALQHAHDQGVIHRDVKPHNILLDKDGEPYITDFGIAVTESELLDDDSDTSGTPAYMAPEQASFAGPAVDPRTDVYSLGVVLYELLVGKVPHTATTLALLRSSFQSKQIPSPSSANPDVTAELSRVCVKAMAVNPNDRWASAEVFADRLRHVPVSSVRKQRSSNPKKLRELRAVPSKEHKISNTLWRKLPQLAALTLVALLAVFGNRVYEMGKVAVDGILFDLDVMLRPAPLEITYRESEDQSRMIASIKNTSKKPLYNVSVLVHDTTIKPLFFHTVAGKFDDMSIKVLNPGETVELSEYYDRPLKSGKFVLVGCDGYRGIAQEPVP